MSETSEAIRIEDGNPDESHRWVEGDFGAPPWMCGEGDVDGTCPDRPSRHMSRCLESNGCVGEGRVSHEYVEVRRVVYGEDGATFVPICVGCGRYVKADETVLINDEGLHPGPNATCAKCGRTRMLFEGFVG
jgi:hypothetical protein